MVVTLNSSEHVRPPHAPPQAVRVLDLVDPHSNIGLRTQTRPQTSIVSFLGRVKKEVLLESLDFILI